MAAILLVVALSLLGGSECAKILAASPFPSISHVLPMRHIVLELVKRGHDVTFITTDPIKKPIENYTEVDISPAYRYLRKSVNWMSFVMKDWDPVEMIWRIEDLAGPICEDGLSSPQMTSFLKYRENMKKLSAVYREHQAESLPKAIWWIEYVLRHKGAPHLRSAAMDLSWYQLLLLDVIAFVFGVTVTCAIALYALARYLISFTFRGEKLKSH